MKTRIAIAVIALGILVLSFVSHVPSQPSFNGTAPGCGGASCHSIQAGIATVTPNANLQVKISLSGTTGNVAGELVDTTGTVVAVMDPTSNNPFTLTAPHAGRYTVNAGFKSPSRQWDSVQVNLSLTGVRPQGDIPGKSFRLDQNFPNPFNPTTVIGYQLSAVSDVNLAVYDILGREVAVLAIGREAPGSYKVRFDATGLATGVYLFRLSAGSFSQTQKMVVLK